MDRCWGARADGGCDEPDGLAGRCCRRGVYRLRGDVTLGRRLVGCRRRAAGTASPGPRGRRPGPPGRLYGSPPSSWNGTSTTRCSRAPQRSAALCTVLHRPRGGTERRPALRLACSAELWTCQPTHRSSARWWPGAGSRRKSTRSGRPRPTCSPPATPHRRCPMVEVAQAAAELAHSPSTTWAPRGAEQVGWIYRRRTVQA
jgi:hypothetical protein